ncbi:Cadherin-like and PC-esterase domain-containing protein 1 [Lamellibrachia satsuma]|nr:Cadherin-like and PC-esterase domain-containing protein 1 [Lamellibrachia satsuma]
MCGFFLQIDKTLLGSYITGQPVEQVAIVLGQAPVIARDLPIYGHALRKAGFTLNIPPKYDSNGDLREETGVNVSCDWPVVGRRWRLLLCLVTDSDDTAVCQCHKTLVTLRPWQKVNHVPGIMSVLWNKRTLCETMATHRDIPALQRSQLSPLCFTLPGQYDSFLSTASSLGPQVSWVSKRDNTSSSVQLLQSAGRSHPVNMHRLSQESGVVQQYIDNPLLLHGEPFSLRVYVLVTSVAPLRAYIHSEGIVQQRYGHQRHFQKVAGRTWTLDHLRQYLSVTFDKDVDIVAFKNLHSAIVQSLLVAELALRRGPVAPSSTQQHRCPSCFQLLGFDVIFNASLHPTVVDVAGQPDLQEVTTSTSWINAVKSSIADDIIAMVTAYEQVSIDVAMALGEFNRDVLVADSECQLTEELCLKRSDVAYLLAWRRETLHKGNFQQLYPAHDSDKYTQLLTDIQIYASHLLMNDSEKSSSTDHTPDDAAVDATTRLHRLAVSVARYYHSLDTVANSYDDLNTPLFPDSSSEIADSPQLVENIFNNSSKLNSKSFIQQSKLNNMYIRQSPCSEDVEDMPFLEGFYTQPKLKNVTPTFDMAVLEYYATVPYDVLLVMVWAFTRSCYSEARLHTKYGVSRPSNVSLGVGANRLTIVIVDVRHAEPWVISTYTLVIERLTAGHACPAFTEDRPHQVCSLIQDCDLRYVPSLSCGLSITRHHSWEMFQRSTVSLPPCGTAAAPGQWMVKCHNCSDHLSCEWTSAVWQPHRCRHPRVPQDVLKKCLAGRQILFIGDSTNRGIMNYLIEATNGSLMEWDKTHETKIYTNINHDRTSVSFAYYPQFWLPSNQRPVFDKTLYQLMKQSQPLQNNTDTVLVVGGVHWLAPHHVSVISRALHREGLSGIKVVIKSLSAGFHQPVERLRHITLQEQRKLLLQNTALVNYARLQGFDVIDTFNMTMGRYKDFLQGQCACHFHRVREMLPSFTQYMRWTEENGANKLTNMPIHFHVEGVINAVYSQLLLSTICAHS